MASLARHFLSTTKRIPLTPLLTATTIHTLTLTHTVTLPSIYIHTHIPLCSRYKFSLLSLSGAFLSRHCSSQSSSSDNKTPMELIDEVPPTEVDASMVTCDGGSGACVYVCTCMCMCMCVYVRVVSVCVCVYMICFWFDCLLTCLVTRCYDIYMYNSARMCICTCMCVCVYICVCVCARVCVCGFVCIVNKQQVPLVTQ